MGITINGNNSATAGGVGYGDGTNLVFTTAGTSGQVLVSAGAGAPTWSGINVSTGVTGTLPIANGGTNTTATPTAGAVPYGTGTALAYTAAGTSGQVLTSTGSGAPTWTTPSAGAMTLISTQTASSSASLSWTGLSGYDKYLLIYQNLVPSAGDYLRMQFGTGAGPTYLTSGYQTYVYGAEYGAGSMQTGGWQDSSVFFLQLTANTTNASGPGISGFIFISGMTSGKIASFSGQSSFINGLGTTNQSTSNIGGTLTGNTTAKTAALLKFGSANITSGSASLYGIS